MKIPNKKDYPSYFVFSIKKNRIKCFLNDFLLFFLLIFLLFGILLISSPKDFNSGKEEEIANNVSNMPNCENLSFENTAICLNNYVREIFVYNSTDDDLELSLEDLKSRGGDCKSWTEFYAKYMNFYGFNRTQIVKMFVRAEELKEGKTLEYYHVFLTASDPSGYCNFDMTDLECYRFVSNSTKEEDDGM